MRHLLKRVDRKRLFRSRCTSKTDNVIVVEIDNEEGCGYRSLRGVTSFWNRSSTEMSKIMNWRLGRQGLPLR